MPKRGPSPASDVGTTRQEQLRDGSIVDVRPIAPSDKQQLGDAYAELSAASRYQRFLISPGSRLSAERLAYLTEVDHHDHEALVALEHDSGRGVGVARFVRLADRDEAAEVAVAVADDWQRQGLATLLLELLSDRARAEGITHFTALLLADNREALDLIERLRPECRVEISDGTAQIDVPLPPAGAGESLAHAKAGRRDISRQG